MCAVTNLTSESKWLQVMILKAAALPIQNICGWVCEREGRALVPVIFLARPFGKQEQHTPFDLYG